MLGHVSVSVGRDDRPVGLARGSVADADQVPWTGGRSGLEPLAPDRGLPEEDQLRIAPLQENPVTGLRRPDDVQSHGQKDGGRGQCRRQPGGSPRPGRLAPGDPGGPSPAADPLVHQRRGVVTGHFRIGGLQSVEASPKLRVESQKPFDPAPFVFGKLAEPIALQVEIGNANSRRVVRAGHEPSICSRVSRSPRSRFRTPETDSPTSRAVCSRVRPSTKCSTAI